jgi:hypothetical protein
VKPRGELQPLAIWIVVWNDISMEFIVGLPKSENKSFIIILVNILSKYAQFCAQQHPFKASTIPQVFMDNIFKFHGIQ